MNRLRTDIERYYALRGCASASTMMRFVACFNPRMVPVVFLRLAEFFQGRHLGVVAKLFSILNVVLFGIEVSPQVRIGGGLFLPHTVGTVIGAASIGDNCTILQGVTLGTTQPDLDFTLSRRPVIGDDVFIGAGAKVLGNVTIGDHAMIGANAVVLRDVPAHALAVGVPARIVKRPSESETEGVT